MHIGGRMDKPKKDMPIQLFLSWCLILAFGWAHRGLEVFFSSDYLCHKLFSLFHQSMLDCFSVVIH